MKTLLRTLMPAFAVDGYRRLFRWLEQKRNRGKTTEQVFTAIYEKNRWGGARGEFCSGAGTVDAETVAEYVAVISKEAARENFRGLTFVDLGCGDFRVGSQLRSLASRYIGADIVAPLVRHHQETYGDSRTEFVHLNVVEDPLPDGDVCFIRQVLQHLSNAQVANVLRKLKKYRWVFITEHYPTENSGIRPNLDKVHGFDVRIYRNSGVYLTEPPFSLPREALTKVLEVPGVGSGERIDAGVIRTFLYKPGAGA